MTPSFRNSPPRPWLRPAVAALLLVISARAGLAGAFVPGSSSDYTVGSGPRAIATGDLNGDGRPDMIVGNEGSSGVSVLIGQPGGFAPAVLYNTGPVPGEVVIADFDGDGKLDFVVGHYNTNTVVIMRGVGDGTFTTGVTLAGPPHPEGLVAADLDNDGMLDLAACGYASTSTGTASVWLNAGTPGGALAFGTRTDYAVGAWPNSIRAGYVTGGAIGLVTANYNGASLSLLANDGTGHFPTRTDLPALPHVYMAEVADLFPGESRPQIVTANADSNSITVYRWDAASASWLRRAYATPNRPSYVAVADADGDGLPDVVTSNYVAGQLSVFHGVPPLDTLTSRVDVPSVANPYAVAVADFDGDGKADLAASNRTGTTVRVTRGQPVTGWSLGDTIPTFTAKNQNGDLTRVGPGMGRWQLLDLCSSWCAPCQSMGSHTEHVYATFQQHSSLRFDYLTMLVDGPTKSVPSTLDDARNWAKRFYLTRPVLHSDGLAAGGTYAVAAASGMLYTPTLRLVGPDGVIRWLGLGYVDEATLINTIARCAGVPVPAPLANSTRIPTTVNDATGTVQYGSQAASSPLYTFGGHYLFMFPQPTGTVGSGLVAELAITRDLISGYESWEATLDGSASPDSTMVPLPSEQTWRLSFSNLSLDPAVHVLPSGSMASVLVDKGTAYFTPTTVTVPVTWSGSTLTIGDLTPAALSPYAPYYGLRVTLGMMTSATAAGVDPAAAAVFALRAPSPNPATRASRLSWTQPRAGEARLDVYDVSGRLVRTLARGASSAGEHTVAWDLADDSGAPVRSGLYFASVRVAGEGVRTTRVTVMR